MPFTVLPGALYWLIPAVLTMIAFWRLRPAPWSVMAMIVLAAAGFVQGPIFWGTPVFWLVPVVAWGGLLGWPAPFVLLKPTLAPFALVGMRRPRAFLMGILLLSVLSLPLIPLWWDWLAAIRHSDLSPDLRHRAGRPPGHPASRRDRFDSSATGTRGRLGSARTGSAWRRPRPGGMAEIRCGMGHCRAIPDQVNRRGGTSCADPG